MGILGMFIVNWRPMSRRNVASLLLAACLLALLVARRAIAPAHEPQTREGVDDAVCDPPSPALSNDLLHVGATSPSAFAAFKIDGMI